MMDRDITARIEAIISRGIGAGTIPGACISIRRQQKSLLHAAYGLADQEQKTPMELDAIFRAFSMTKPVTATVTMMLWEQGLLDLLDPVWWYFPTFREKKVVEHGKLVPAQRDILIQDLLNMTSGIPYPDCWSEAHQAMATLFDEMERRQHTDQPIDTQEFATRVGSDVPLVFQPGEKWLYGASADVLGAVLEKVADMPLDELYRKLLFQPLGMVDTDFYIPEEKRSRLAQLYIHDETTGKLRVEPDPHLGMTDYHGRPAFFSGGAGLVTTLHDYVQFVDLLAGKGYHAASGQRLLGENTWRYLTTPQLTTAQKGSIDWPQLTGYSYGNLMRVLVDPQASMTNVLAGEFGWDGWSGPYFYVSPQDETTLVYLIQVCNGSNSDIVRRLRAASI